jgi:hypothetical protein
MVALNMPGAFEAEGTVKLTSASPEGLRVVLKRSLSLVLNPVCGGVKRYFSKPLKEVVP